MLIQKTPYDFMKLYKAFVLLGFVMTLFSCGQTRYMPTLANANFFEEKGEYRVEAGMTANPMVNGAYAFADHWSVQGVLGYRHYKSEYNQWTPDTAFVTEKRNTFHYQGGIGFQTNLNPTLVFESYFGFMYSNTTQKEQFNYVLIGTSAETKDKEYDRYVGAYLNPAIGYNGPGFRWGYMHKMAYVLANNPDYAKIIMEPTVFIGFGGNVKFNLQATFPLTKKNDIMMPYNVYGGVSMSYHFKNPK